MYLKVPLDKDMLDAGRSLTRELVKVVPLTASFWFYFPETQTWRLMIASSDVSKLGPRKVYQFVQNAIAKLPDGAASRVALENVSVVENRHPIVHLLRSIIRTGSRIANIRFANNTVNGIHVDDAFIYLMK